MRFQSLLLSLAILFTGTGMGKDKGKSDPAPNTTTTDAPTTASPTPRLATKNYNTLGLALYRALRTQGEFNAKSGNNLVCSPLSIATVTEALWLGAQADTATQIGTALRADPPKPDIANDAPSIALAALGEGRSDLRMATGVWMSAKQTLQSDYPKLVQARLGSQAETLDFSKPDEAAKRINDWTSEHTDHHIEQILSPSELRRAQLVLTNAVFFKGAWERPFPKDQTKPGDFTLLNGKKTTTAFMHQKLRATNAKPEAGLSVLVLPFAPEGRSMIFLLPAPGVKAMIGLEAKLTTENLDRWLADVKTGNVEVTLPRFKMEASMPLIEAFQESGVTAPFDGSVADFRGMTNKHDLYVSVFKHQATLEVNEEGAEASAATSAVMIPRSLTPVPMTEFRADHPFLCLLRDDETGVILFIARVAQPEVVEKIRAATAKQ